MSKESRPLAKSDSSDLHLLLCRLGGWPNLMIIEQRIGPKVFNILETR